MIGCRSEEITKNESISTRYESKSLWPEDEKYIKNVKEIYEKNSREINITPGKPFWDYASTMGHFDETFLLVPFIEKGNVVAAMQVVRKGRKIYFAFQEDRDNNSFFQAYIFAKNKKPVDNESTSAKTLCSTKTISVWIPNKESNTDPSSGQGHWETRTQTSCFQFDDECVGIYDPYAGCTGGGGSGYDYPDPSVGGAPAPQVIINEQNVRNNPCFGNTYGTVTNDNDGIIKDFISNFRPANSLTDVSVGFFTENSSTAGRTSITGNQIVIQFNTEFLGSDPTYMAKVVAHKFIHAHLFDELVRTQTLSRNVAQGMNIFELFDKSNTLQSQLATPSGQHYIMAGNYINFLIDVMKSYDAQNGLSHTDQQYKMLAWAGLDSTPQFEQSGYLNASWDNNIKNLINKKPCTR